MAILSDKDLVFLRQLVFLLQPSVNKFSVEDVDIASNVRSFLLKFGISKLSALRLMLPIETASFNSFLFGNFIFFLDLGLICSGVAGAGKTGCCQVESSGLKRKWFKHVVSITI